MSWNYNYGEPSFADSEPVSFREAPYYGDVYYRRDFRLQHPADVDDNHGGYLFPQEQVLVRPLVDAAAAGDAPAGPWWHNPDHPHNGRGAYGGYPVYVVEHPHGQAAAAAESTSTVELYVPQLCCDNCERRVVECLNDMAGVERVSADQWEKKVVVVGRDHLRPDHVLRRLHRDLHMPRSVFWHQR